MTEEGYDDATADKMLNWLAEALDVKDWSPCDGTEEWDSDARGSLYRILNAANIYDEDTGKLSEPVATIQRLRTALAASEAKLEKAREALRPFALISIEGVAKTDGWYTSITTQADYFHRAAATLKDIA